MNCLQGVTLPTAEPSHPHGQQRLLRLSMWTWRMSLIMATPTTVTLNSSSEFEHGTMSSAVLSRARRSTTRCLKPSSLGRKRTWVSRTYEYVSVYILIAPNFLNHLNNRRNFRGDNHPNVWYGRSGILGGREWRSPGKVQDRPVSLSQPMHHQSTGPRDELLCIQTRVLGATRRLCDPTLDEKSSPKPQRKKNILIPRSISI